MSPSLCNVLHCCEHEGYMVLIELVLLYNNVEFVRILMH